MKEKIKIILLFLIVISLFMFSVVYTFRTLIDYGCSSPKLFSIPETEGIKKFKAMSFLGVRCLLWNKSFQIQQNL